MVLAAEKEVRFHLYHEYEPYPYHVVTLYVGRLAFTWTVWQWRFILKPWKYFGRNWAVQIGPLTIALERD